MPRTLAWVAVLLLWAVPSFATITVVAHGSAASAANDGVTVTLNSTGGDLAVVCAHTYQAATEPVLSDAVGGGGSNSWNPLTSKETSGGGRVKAYWAHLTSTGASHGFSLSDTDSFPAETVLILAGTNASPFDQQSGANAPATATTAQPGSLTPAAANYVVVACTAWVGNNTLSIDAPFTKIEQVDFVGATVIGGAIAYDIQTTATARNPTWTWGANVDGGNVLADFKIAGGGGGGSTTSHLLGGGIFFRPAGVGQPRTR